MADNLEFPNFFGTVKDLAQARYLMAERDKLKGDRAAGPDVAAALGGDRDALGRVATQSPDMAMRLTQALSQMDYRQATLAKSHIELAGRLAAGVLGAPPDQRPALYAAALDQARGLGIDTSKFPQVYDGPSGAAHSWMLHNMQMLGTAQQVFKRVGAPGGAPAAGGGGGGWTNPVSPGARTSDAAPPGGPMVADAGGGMPAPAVAGMPQAAPAMAPPAQAPTTLAGAGPQPMALPAAAPRIAPTAAPGARPTQVAGGPPTGGGAAPDDSGGEGDFVPSDRVGQGRWVGLDPGDTIKVDRHNEPIAKDGMLFIQKRDGRLMMLDPKSHKTFTPVPAGDQIHLVDNESGQTVRTIPVTKPVDHIEPLGAPASADADPRAAVRGLQLPPGVRVAGVNGQPVVKDGTVMIVKQDGSYDFVPLPTRADPASRAAPQGYRPDPNNPEGLTHIVGGPADPDVMRARREATQLENAKAIQPGALEHISANLAGVRKIDDAMHALAHNPDSVGGPGSRIAANVPGAGGLQNRSWADPEGTTLRALIADISSLKIHDRSGAAVSVSEDKRLVPFIPSISDDAAAVRKKLAGLRNEYAGKLDDMASYYTPENGFKTFKPLADYAARAGGMPPAVQGGPASVPAGGPGAGPSAPASAAPVRIYDPKSGGFQ